MEKDYDIFSTVECDVFDRETIHRLAEEYRKNQEKENKENKEKE